jgi:ATP-dependent DNA ligase
VAFQRKKPAAIGVKAPYPGFIEPELATTADKVPSGERWLREIKFDGYRVQVHLRDAAVKVFTRRGHDWTNRFRKVAADAWHINAGSAIINGEVVVPAANDATDLTGMPARWSRTHSSGKILSMKRSSRVSFVSQCTTSLSECAGTGLMFGGAFTSCS